MIVIFAVNLPASVNSLLTDTVVKFPFPRGFLGNILDDHGARNSIACPASNNLLTITRYESFTLLM